MIRCRNGIRSIITSLILLVGAAAAQAQNETEAEAREWQENVRAFNEGIDSNLSPNDDPGNGAGELLEIMKTLRAIKELETLAIEYENLLVHGEFEIEDEEAALRSDVARRRLALTDDVVKRLRKNLKSEYFDFGVDHSQGVDMLLPHLSPLRQMARLLALRAKVLIRENRFKEANDVLVDMLRLSKVTRDDQTAISSLVGASISAMALRFVEDAMTDQRLDAQSAMPFRMGTMYLEKDPFGMQDAALAEYEMMRTSILGLTGEERSDFLELMVSNREDRQYLTQLDRDALVAELESTEVFYRMLGDALNAESDLEIADQVKAVIDEAMQEENSALSSMLLAPWQKMVTRMIVMSQLHEDMAESLRQITRGVDPGYFGNAMTLYYRSMPKLARIPAADQETMAMVRRILQVSGTCDALPNSLRERLQSIFEMLRPLKTEILRAAKIRRCVDLSTNMRMLEKEGFPLGRNVRGMQAAGRFLLTEAALGICQHKDGLATQKQVSESLVGALGIAIHMADGSHLMGQLAAASLLEEIAQLLELGVRTGSVGPDIVPELRERLQRCQGDDPFNWEKTTRMLRGSEVLDTIQTFGMKDRELARRLARGWSEDRLFLAQFFKGGRPERGDTPLKSPKFAFESGGQRGSLHSLEHIFDPSEQDLETLEGPHERLLQLINAIDTVESPSIMEWKMRSLEAYEKIETLTKELTPAGQGHGMKKPDSKKMDNGMGGMKGH